MVKDLINETTYFAFYFLGNTNIVTTTTQGIYQYAQSKLESNVCYYKLKYKRT